MERTLSAIMASGSFSSSLYWRRLHLVSSTMSFFLLSIFEPYSDISSILFIGSTAFSAISASTRISGLPSRRAS